jgi:hypothetical protein
VTVKGSRLLAITSSTLSGDLLLTVLFLPTPVALHAGARGLQGVPDPGDRVYGSGRTAITAVGVASERKESLMGITLSLLISAAGAILIWAVHTTSSGFNVHTAGIILLVVGIIGFVLSVAFWTSWGAWGLAGERDRRESNHTTVVR